MTDMPTAFATEDLTHPEAGAWALRLRAKHHQALPWAAICASLGRLRWRATPAGYGQTMNAKGEKFTGRGACEPS